MSLILVAPFIYLMLGYPTLRLLKRAGYSGWWSLLCVLPLINIVAFWVLALSKWPNSEQTTSVFE